MYEDKEILIFQVRTSRIKALPVAIAEVYALLYDLEPEYLPGGPMGDQKGIFKILLDRKYIDEAINRFTYLGYVNNVSRLFYKISERKNNKKYNTWKGKSYELESIYCEDAETFRMKAPDKREFILIDHELKHKTVKGYRGSSGELDRRALPVEDSRLLVNLTFAKAGEYLLDPFAGAGGIVIESVEKGIKTVSSDIDPILEPGLKKYGSEHHVSSIENLPFPNLLFDAIATEVPFSDSVTDIILKGMVEMYRVTKYNSKISLMCADRQAEKIRKKAEDLGLQCFLDVFIDRKGLPVHIFAWSKQPFSKENDNHFFITVQTLISYRST